MPAPVLDAGRPLLTFYDDETGERTELTAVEMGEWAARTAALLRDGCGLGPGCRAAVLLPPHWQTAVVLMGAWAAGVAVSVRLAATAGLPSVELGGDEPLDAVFVDRRRADDWLEEVPAATYQFVLGSGPAIFGYRDYLAEVAGYPAAVSGYAGVRRTDPASVDGTTYHQWGTLAREVAGVLDLRAGDRVLIDAAEHEHPVKWLLAPLAAGATIVLCANLNRATLEARLTAESVTRVL
jgi:uncharacterized protein (TIGR03089 family)